MVNSRNKGAAWERAVAKELLLLTGITFRRDLDQTREKGRGDLLPSDDAWPFLIECKAHASGTGCKPAWRQQATEAAQDGQFPAVVYKYDRRDPRVSVPMEAVAAAYCSDAHKHTDEWADVTLEGFAYLAREIMAWR